MKLKHALLHNTGWKMIGMLFTFLNNILIVRLLGVEGSANLFYALALFVLISTILKFGLENGIIYFLSKNKEYTGAVSLLLIIVLSIQVILTIVILKFFIKEIEFFTLIWAVYFIMGNIMLYYVNAFYQVKKMFISLNVACTAIVFLQTALLLYLYISSSNFLVEHKIARNNIDAMMLISGITIIFQMIVLIPYYYSKNKNDFNVLKLDLPVIKNIFSYSIVNFVITVIFFLVLRADIFFVERYCDRISLSNYLQASKIGQMLLVFPGLIAGVIFPYTIDAPTALAGKIAYLCRFLTFLYFIIYIVVLVAGKFVFTWMLGPGFSLMYEIFAVSFFGVYFLSISLLFISYFEGINKLRIIVLSLAITLITLIILNCILIPYFGYIAGALVFSISNAIGSSILFSNFKEHTNISIAEILILKRTDLKKLTI